MTRISRTFTRARRRMFQSIFLNQQDRRYQPRPRARTASVLPELTRVSVSGSNAPFENRSNISLYAGKKVKVVNAGRPAQVLYVPSFDADTV